MSTCPLSIPGQPHSVKEIAARVPPWVFGSSKSAFEYVSQGCYRDEPQRQTWQVSIPIYDSPSHTDMSMTLYARSTLNNCPRSIACCRFCIPSEARLARLFHVHTLPKNKQLTCHFGPCYALLSCLHHSRVTCFLQWGIPELEEISL